MFLSPLLQQVVKPVCTQLACHQTLVRYFIMKSSNIRNLEISQQKGIWSTTPSNETKLTKAFLENSAIILIFSVQGSGHFQVTLCMHDHVCQSHDADCEIATVKRKSVLKDQTCVFVFVFTGLCSHDVCRQSGGELSWLGPHGTRRGFQCRMDTQRKYSLPVHPAYPQPMEWQQEGPD